MTLNLSLSQLVLAASMVLVAMAISTWQHLGLSHRRRAWYRSTYLHGPTFL